MIENRINDSSSPPEVHTPSHPVFELSTELLDNYAEIRPLALSNVVHKKFAINHNAQALFSRETPEFRTSINGKEYTGKIAEGVVVDTDGQIVRIDRAYVRTPVIGAGTRDERRGTPEAFFYIRPDGAHKPASDRLYDAEVQQNFIAIMREIAMYYYREYGKTMHPFKAA